MIRKVSHPENGRESVAQQLNPVILASAQSADEEFDKAYQALLGFRNQVFEMEEVRPATGHPVDLEIVVSYVLLGGVLTSMVLLLGGLAWHGLRSGTLRLEYTLRPANFFNFALSEFQNAFHGAYRPRLVVSLGIVVLMLTPFIRVLASMLYFALVEKNVKYAVFTLIVLAALSYSLFLR